MRLEGINLSYRYGQGSWLFRDLGISLETGKITGLLGASGSGKTTLGRILAGYEWPLEGTVLIDGKSVSHKGYHPVQMVFQHPERAVNPRWIVGRILQESWGNNLNDMTIPSNRTLSRVMEAFGVDPDWWDRRPAQLSGGELQRICIVRALAPGTRFLIADEITTMLDAISQAQVWHALIDFAREHALGMLVISHDRQLLQQVCDHIFEWADLRKAQQNNETIQGSYT